MADTNDSPVSPEGAESAQDRPGVVSARDRFQRLTEEFQDRYGKVSSDVRRGAERATSEIRRGAERARDTYRDAADNARLGYAKLRVESGRYGREISDYVRDNPGRAVALAAGVGFLIGLLVRRGRDDE
jgi:ElaB/YqjD/DUF883 family membrane-anchored ribosome-binding protein